eukprot:jgi/Tetstr1/448067/TSEL_035366.t1
MAFRACRALAAAAPAMRTAAGQRALTAAGLSPAVPSSAAPLAVAGLHATRGFAALAGEMSENILATKSTKDLTDLLERSMGQLDPKSAGTALVRLALLGGNFPGERELQTRLEKIMPALAKHVPSMDGSTQPLANHTISRAAILEPAAPDKASRDQHMCRMRGCERNRRAAECVTVCPDATIM